MYIKQMFRKIFRYKLTSIFFLIGQLIVYGTIFGALGIYNKAYDKETDRLNSIYESCIQLDVVTSKKIDIFSYLPTNVDTGNMTLKGRLSLGIQELGTSMRCEMILKANEPLNYKLLSGRLPGDAPDDAGKNLVAAGINKVKEATEKDGKKYLTIEGEVYEVVGVLGSEKSDYWDNTVVLNLNCIGENTLKSIMTKQEYVIELGSNNGELDKTYSAVYGNIKSVDSDAVINATKINSTGESTIENTLARENIRVNVIAYFFCVLNCMIMSEFWMIQRRKEFAIKKAFGMSNIRIIGQIAASVAVLGVVAFIIFIAGFLILKIFPAANVPDISFSINSLLIAVSSILITFIVTMIYPVYKIIKFDPAEQI